MTKEELFKNIEIRSAVDVNSVEGYYSVKVRMHGKQTILLVTNRNVINAIQFNKTFNGMTPKKALKYLWDRAIYRYNQGMILNDYKED